MNYKGILSSLKNQLKPRKKNKQYLTWRAEHRKLGMEGHHILKKKRIDLLLADIPKQFHIDITVKREATELEQIEMLVSALDEIFDYTEYLQDSSTSN